MNSEEATAAPPTWRGVGVGTTVYSAEILVDHVMIETSPVEAVRKATVKLKFCLPQYRYAQTVAYERLNLTKKEAVENLLETEQHECDLMSRQLEILQGQRDVVKAYLDRMEVEGT